MTFELRAISGTDNHVIVQRATPDAPATLVAEVVRMPNGMTIYRMDVTGVLGEGFAGAEEALEFFTEWVRTTGTNLAGVTF